MRKKKEKEKQTSGDYYMFSKNDRLLFDHTHTKVLQLL